VKNLLKKTSKVLFVILLIIIIIIASGLILGNVYKDEIRNYVISEINKEIEVKVSIRSADFSVLKKFPFVSIVLTDVVAFSGKDIIRSEFTGMPYDTLLTASRIYMQFNIIDLLRKDYRLRKVHAVNGKVIILVDSKGGVNYRVLKPTKKGSETGNLTFSLDGVKMSKFSWQFLNIAKDIYSEGEVKELALKGRFSQHSFSLNTLSSFYISSFKREGIEYASNLNLGTRLILDVRDSLFTISRGDLSINDLRFKTSGSVSTGTNTILDINIAGESMNIKSLLSALPFNTDQIKKYSPSGNVDVLAKITGAISSTNVPAIRAAFKFSDGKVFLPDQGKSITGITINGTYSNGSRRNASSSRLNLSEYSVNYGINNLKGSLSIDNFIKPFLSASLSGTILAKDLSDLVKIDGMDLYEGFIYPNLSLNLSFDSFETVKMENISGEGITGNLGFKNISGKIPYPDLPLELLEGNIKMEGETWLTDLILKIGKNSFSAELVVNHFWEYFINHTNSLGVSGDISSGYLNIPDFLVTSTSSESTNFKMPDSIYLKLHCNVDSFVYGKFFARDFETWFNYKPDLLTVSSADMNTMNGKISGTGAVIEDNSGQMLFRASGELRKIDIFKLFNTFNNFGQDFIVDKNLRGTVSGNLVLSAQISPQLEFLTENLTAESDFVIEDGELINFEPANELSAFVELSELQHIRFSTLENTVLIKDEKVYIPQMDINSSAFNIAISGTHGFDNYFDYKLRLNLNEILAAKVKRVKKENEEFGVVEDDGAGRTNIYLSVIGTPDDFKIRYDKKEAVNKIKSDLQEEKKLLKTILKEELGLFKKDSLDKVNMNSNEQNDQFILDWEDEKDVPEEPVKRQKEKKLKKKEPALEITWDEDDDENK